jgi:hypothetical protein
MKNLFSKILTAVFAAALTACSSQTVLQQPIVDTGVISTGMNGPASFLRFDAGNPEVQRFFKAKGLPNGYKVSVSRADLVFSPDNWKSTLTSQKQYLIDNSEGFILRNIVPGTEIEFAVHAWLCISYDNFRSCDQQPEMWANNNGKNYRAATSAK